MNIIEFKDVAKSFFSQKLYKNVNLEINSYDKIALTGHNGTGKSTLIKLIIGEQYPDSGEIEIAEDAIISCFDQFGNMDLNLNVEELLNQPFEKVIAAQKKMEDLALQFTDNTDESLLKEYSKATETFDDLGGYDYLHIIAEFIEVFEISDKLERKFKELSGGEKQYIRLATTLFSDSDLIILDEPLSYFDRKKTTWLSKYIAESYKAFVVISHNVDFIRGFANKIFDVDNMAVTQYDCNHKTFLREKKANIKEGRKHNLKTELEMAEKGVSVERKEKLIERVDNKHAHAVILRRMERELERLESQKVEFSPEYKYEYAKAPEEFFILNRDIGKEILSISNVTKEYPGKLLYKDANLEINNDTKICIVGENGAGKSTLLRILAGQEEATSGDIKINERAKISFIEQETVLVDEQITIKEYLKDKTGLSEDFIEEAIGSLYNYEEEFQYKKLFMLSGGEKKRLEIFAHILAETHLLIVDEPSTYMDDYSRGTIAQMLREYPGAVIMVTHDKSLLRQIDNFELYDIRDNRLRVKQVG